MKPDYVYDSRSDTLNHIRRVAALLEEAAIELRMRGLRHDQSKLVEPEKSAFDSAVPKLKDLKYGTPEYKAALAELGPALQHHYANNSHHPEHFECGVSGMTLFDVLEMLVDWKAASERMKNGGDIAESIRINSSRFTLDPQLVSILTNTARAFQWIP